MKYSKVLLTMIMIGYGVKAHAQRDVTELLNLRSYQTYLTERHPEITDPSQYKDVVDMSEAYRAAYTNYARLIKDNSEELDGSQNFELIQDLLGQSFYKTLNWPNEENTQELPLTWMHHISRALFTSWNESDISGPDSFGLHRIAYAASSALVMNVFVFSETVNQDTFYYVFDKYDYDGAPYTFMLAFEKTPTSNLALSSIVLERGGSSGFRQTQIKPDTSSTACDRTSRWGYVGAPAQELCDLFNAMRPN